MADYDHRRVLRGHRRGEAPAADKMKLAVGQCGNWDSSPVELGMRIGTYAKYGIDVEALCTQGTGETQQAVIAGSTVSASASARWARSAPLPRARLFASSRAAPPATPIWIVKGDSPLKAIPDAAATNTVAYSTNGASTHSAVLGFIRELGLKARPIATGGPAATITLLMSGQVDIGWSSPPLGFDLLDAGKIRIFARAKRRAQARVDRRCG